ncbi:uncharacterized protein LOC119093343 [Pollicipes pollicipes]|uniref:uncharacterized protein LOC119093343 n=1 Tax=Pollicipes pollicipes TaxID=41117 RepID=UPI00188520B9|nr:uncharacterized protein LOC119093343 [Pollicipes pollicipes]
MKISKQSSISLFFDKWDEEAGNVIRFLTTVAQHDPVLKRWLARRKESRMHFTSPEALAEVQRQLAHAVIRRVVDECYDGAANMAGAFRGVQARVKAVEPRAVFVHCTAHRLNLVCQEALNGMREVRDAIQERGVPPAFLTSVVKQYGPLVTSVNELADEAKVTTPAMRTMQGQSQSVSANLGVARAVRDVVLSQRDRFERLWAELTSDAERLGVGCPGLRRPLRPPRRLDGGSEPHQHACPKGRYRQAYCEAVDWLAGSISGRFDSDEPTLATAEKALLTAEEDALVATATFYNLDLERLRLHCQMLVDVASSQRKAPLTSLDDVVALLSDEGLRQVLPAATSLLRLVLTAPATSCTAERAFSLLRRLRGWLRSTLGQERLNHAAVLATYPDMVDALDLQAELKQLASASRSAAVAADLRWVT